MGRDALVSVLCGMLGAKGRDEALLGDDMGDVRRAFSRMAPEGDAVHAYFEVPLLGARGLDVHCSVSDAVAAGDVPVSADPAWRDALAWLADFASVETRGGDVQLMAEADTSADPTARPGTYLIYRDRDDLVAPYLGVVGESDRVGAWEAFRACLPKGWETTYVGLFPGRPGGLLRVNAHPATADAAGLEEAMGLLGLSADDGSLALCRNLLDGTRGFDLQLDVDDDGRPAPDFAFEAYLEGKRLSASPWDDGRADRAFSLMEACGAADGRWRSLVGADVSRSVALPVAGRMASCAVSLRTFSAKVRLAGGRPALAKAYLRGDAFPLA